MPTLIPYPDALALIGHVNPGLGYWWTQTNGTWCLCVPPPPVHSAFWPVFVVGLLVLGSLAWLLAWGRAPVCAGRAVSRDREEAGRTPDTPISRA